jgi:hypothetical protein
VVRLVVVALLLVVAELRAEACPRGTACVASQTRSLGGETGTMALVVAPARPLLQLAVDRGEPRDLLAHSLATHVAPAPRAVTMPWIWVVLKKSVYRQLPTYERRGARPENHFSLVLAPVVVDSPTDSVPGVGVEGGF